MENRNVIIAVILSTAILIGWSMYFENPDEAQRKNNVIHIDKAIDQQLGFVGDPKKIDTKMLNNFFKQKIIPVIAPSSLGVTL